MDFKKKSSVVVSIDGNKNKKIQIPTFIVFHWKKVLFSSAIVLFLLLTGVIYFVSQTTDENTARYHAKINELKKRNKALAQQEEENHINYKEVKRQMGTFDSTLNRINDKMRKRGLKAIAIPNAGGPVEAEEEENLEELAKYYSTVLRDIEKKLEGAPYGRPHNGRITSRFGYRANPFTGRGREMHSGVDLKGRRGELVKSTANGIVTFSGYKSGYGYVVEVKHNNGYETVYGHLSRLRVKKGQRIEVGTTIGLLGSTGRSTGPHLHYEVIKDNRKLNPEKFFSF